MNSIPFGQSVSLCSQSWLKSFSSPDVKPPRLYFESTINKIHLTVDLCLWCLFEKVRTHFAENPNEWNGNNADSAGQTIFLGFWICPASTDFPPAGGVWGGMRAGFGLGFSDFKNSPQLFILCLLLSILHYTRLVKLFTNPSHLYFISNKPKNKRNNCVWYNGTKLQANEIDNTKN